MGAVLASVCLAVLTTACGGGDDRPAGEREDAQPTTTASPPTTARFDPNDPQAPNGVPIDDYPDACEVLPAAEVERVLAAPVTAEGQQTRIGSVRLPKPLACEYRVGGRDIVSARIDIGVSRSPEDARRLFNVAKGIGQGEDLRPIPGLGDEAYESDVSVTKINVLSGVYAYTVQVGFDRRWRDQTIELARIVDRNLEGDAGRPSGTTR